eukprot:scaffold2060_cov161-Alexandrium_tamarense.AAC.2
MSSSDRYSADREAEDNDANATATEPQHEVLALKKLISPVSSVDNEYSVIDSTGVVNIAVWKDIHAQDDATTTAISPSLASKRRQIREKEAEIELKKGALEEVARLNRKKEQEINERMAALDAATAALLERANNVQQVINQRLALRHEVQLQNVENYPPFHPERFHNNTVPETEPPSTLQLPPVIKEETPSIFQQLTNQVYQMLDYTCVTPSTTVAESSVITHRAKSTNAVCNDRQYFPDEENSYTR